MVHAVNDESSDFVRLELAVVVTDFDKHEISLVSERSCSILFMFAGDLHAVFLSKIRFSYPPDRFPDVIIKNYAI